MPPYSSDVAASLEPGGGLASIHEIRTVPRAVIVCWPTHISLPHLTFASSDNRAMRLPNSAGGTCDLTGRLASLDAFQKCKSHSVKAKDFNVPCQYYPLLWKPPSESATFNYMYKMTAYLYQSTLIARILPY